MDFCSKVSTLTLNLVRVNMRWMEKGRGKWGRKCCSPLFSLGEKTKEKENRDAKNHSSQVSYDYTLPLKVVIQVKCVMIT